MQLYGHRGARAEAPENTLPGFRRAIAAGVLRVELDLHLSRDGELVVIHDDTLERTTDGRGRVAEHTVAQLAALDARRGGPGWPERVGVPSLPALLDACPELLHLQLECKQAAPAGREHVARRLSALFAQRQLHARATVTSFDTELLRTVRNVDASIPIAYVTDSVHPEPLATALALGARLLVMHHPLCTAERIAAAHAAGVEVSAWTVNELDLGRELRARGVDSLITDKPTLFAGAL